MNTLASSKDLRNQEVLLLSIMNDNKSKCIEINTDMKNHFDGMRSQIKINEELWVSYSSTLDDIRKENKSMLIDIDVYKKSIFSEFKESKKEVETSWLEHTKNL